MRRNSSLAFLIGYDNSQLQLRQESAGAVVEDDVGMRGEAAAPRVQQRPAPRPRRRPRLDLGVMSFISSERELKQAEEPSPPPADPSYTLTAPLEPWGEKETSTFATDQFT